MPDMTEEMRAEAYARAMARAETEGQAAADAEKLGLRGRETAEMCRKAEMDALAEAAMLAPGVSAPAKKSKKVDADAPAA